MSYPYLKVCHLPYIASYSSHAHSASERFFNTHFKELWKVRQKKDEQQLRLSVKHRHK